MYYHLSNHIYVTQFRDELILLDTIADRYTVCFKEFTELLGKLLGEKSAPLSPQEYSFVQKLVDAHILQTAEAPFPYSIDKKLDSPGVANVDWRLPLEDVSIGFNFQILHALFVLIKIHCLIKFKGFCSTICLIKKARKENLSYKIPNDEELTHLANVLNQACLFYPTRTKCLEWAMTYVLLALKRGWKCNLEIGVQNYPFFAHAWVECNGRVVMDDQNLRKGLSIILNEPFRRLRP